MRYSRELTGWVCVDIFNEVVLFALAILCGGAVRLTLALVGQRWSMTYSNTVTYLILPVVGLVVVQVISNSIALSLGMIGALSIVRFRHPVKSPLELVVYFLLLTVGIALSTRPELAIALTAASIVVIVGVSLYQAFSKRKKGPGAFPVSATDGERRFLLEVASDRALPVLNDSPYLVFANSQIAENRYTYKLAFEQRADFAEQQRVLGGLEGVVSTSSFVS